MMAGRRDDDDDDHTTEDTPWYWQDHSSLKLDSDSPLAAISRSFWDDFTQNERDPQALFPPPPGSDSRYSNPSLFSMDNQESNSQGSPSSSDYGVQLGERYKRRRMLQFTGARTDLLPTDSPSFTSVLPSGLENCVNPSIPGSDDYLMPIFTAASPLWYTRNDDATGPAVANAQQLGDKWMVRCFERNNMGNNSAHHPMEATKVPQTAPMLDISEMKTSVPLIDFNTGSCSQPWQPQHRPEAEILQGPVTPFSKPPLSGRKPLTDASRFKLKSSTPVAYPFALLKPYSAEGAVTLNDINKRLLSPPPRPVQGPLPIENERPATQSGSGLSGKSVVACTKIHTEGNGTITIMRTKG
ncbi:unnamed protein product [Sphagnum troendelagicum]|uniref:Protein XRI1 n=1 Tax=Sphagnum troendelagicum TaxID=128251 RepID=A0ABP0TEB1_9BRYO